MLHNLKESFSLLLQTIYLVVLLHFVAMVLLPFLLSLFFQLTMTYSMEDSALYRNPTGDFSVGDFKLSNNPLDLSIT